MIWEHPPEDWVKLNTDGASKQGGSKASCGGLLRDPFSAWIWGFAANLGASSSVEAELWGLYYSLLIAWFKNHRRVIIAIDSKEALFLLQRRDLQGHPLAPLILSCRHIMAMDWELKIKHTLREGNRAADKLANWGSTQDPGLKFLEKQIQEVGEIMDDDTIRKGIFRIVSDVQ